MASNLDELGVIMRRILSFLFCVSLVLFRVPSGFAQTDDNQKAVTEAVLDIAPVEQKTLAWCWLSVGEMIFTYLDLDEPPSGYQCGTMAMIGGPASICWTNCARCPFGAQTMPNLERMVRDYPRAIAAYQGHPVPLPLTLSSRYAPLDWTTVKTQIMDKSPIVAAINPLDPSRHVPQHVALIVGYMVDKHGDHFLLVNDPAPYSLLDVDPYGDKGAETVQDFQYWIDYDKFKSGFAWNYSAYGIHDPSHHKQVSELGISLKHSAVQQTAAGAPSNGNNEAADTQVYLPLEQTLPKWVSESSTNFFGHKIEYQLGTHATPGFNYLGDKRECDITDPTRHKCVFALYGGTDSAEAQYTFERLDNILASTLSDYTTVDIPSPIDAAGGAIKILKKRTRTKNNVSFVLDKEMMSGANDVSYYNVDLTFSW